MVYAELQKTLTQPMEIQTISVRHTKSADVPENMRMSLTDYCRQMRSADDETTEFGDERPGGEGDADIEGETEREIERDAEVDERTDESQ